MAATNRIIPKPMTFQVTDTMIAHVDRSASTPEPEDRLVDEPEVQQDLVDEPEGRAEQPVPQQARHAEADDDRHEDDRPGDPPERRVAGDVSSASR